VINQALITICNLRNETAHIIAVLGFLEGVYKQYIDLVWSHDGKIDANRVCESLASLKNDANGLVIHLRRAEDKGAIKFNVDIALQNERNNKINTEIARLTAQIAVDSKRDSSSMITYEYSRMLVAELAQLTLSIGQNGCTHHVLPTRDIYFGEQAPLQIQLNASLIYLSGPFQYGVLQCIHGFYRQDDLHSFPLLVDVSGRHHTVNDCGVCGVDSLAETSISRYSS